jgi:lipoprotein signal peptidase
MAGLGRAELGERLGGFVYGTIVVLSVIVTGLRAFPHGLWDVAVLVAVTTVVFWLAHVYAHGIAFSMGQNEHLSLKELDHIGRREASIVGAGVPPEVALVLGATGLLSDQVATWLAFGLGLVVLGAVGVVFARVERLSPGRTVLAIVANLVLGLVLIGLKVLVVH